MSKKAKLDETYAAVIKRGTDRLLSLRQELEISCDQDRGIWAVPNGPKRKEFLCKLDGRLFDCAENLRGILAELWDINCELGFDPRGRNDEGGLWQNCNEIEAIRQVLHKALER